MSDELNDQAIGDPCKHCGGKGFRMVGLGGDSETCERCKGTGVVQAPSPETLTVVFTRRLLAAVGVATPEHAPPLATMDMILREVAARAIELDDKPLHKLMLRLSLYAVADPGSPDYNPLLVQRMLSE